MENKPQSYNDLNVWQKGIDLAKLIYALTARFPGEERFGLVSQMRRAAVSIPSNIAEGQRGTQPANSSSSSRTPKALSPS